ncbi:MAG: response regulator [Desulfobacterales bacterium]|nr:response regulator [Desulfobacterales bacterium]
MKRQKILIVDDIKINIIILREILCTEYDISVGINSEDAIKFAKENKPDLILLDIMMPSVDGFEVCKILRQHKETKDIPIIFVTARSDDDTINKAFEVGGTDYVRKPINPVELISRIKSALNQQELTNKLLYEEKFKAVIEMAGAICHELNQPMQSIIGYTDLMLMSIDDDHEFYDPVSEIKSQTSLIGEITGKLMAITKYETIEHHYGKKIIDIHKSSSS